MPRSDGLAMGRDWGSDSGGRLSRRRAITLGGAAAVTALSTTGLPATGDPAAGTRTTDDPVTQLHDEGITGDGVRVGVLDTTGFAAGQGAVADAVIGRRSFDGVPVVADGTTHGTAAATTVARVAPGAELLLASFEQPSGFRRALAWLRGTDVDIVLAPVAAYGAGVVGRSAVTRAAASTVAAGVTVVGPTGNAARGHWRGTLTPAAGPQRLRLGSGDDAVDGRLLVWAGSPDSDAPEISLALVRGGDGTGDRELIALSERGEQDGVERLDVTVSSGEYMLDVRLPDSPDTGSTASSVAVTTPTQRVPQGDPRGSIAAPASAPGVFAVGRLTDGRVAPYSGRGPTHDGRRGVDLVARPRRWPTDDDPGTSGAAAYVAGVAALVTAAAPASATAEPAASLRSTASRSSNPAVAAGYGALDAVGAVRRARPDG